jgi:hypothetical protein
MIMGYDRKYGKVTTENGDIPDDEPVIVFRARDVTTTKLLSYYLMICAKAGSPVRHLDIIIGTLFHFRRWQQEHPDRVKVPDSERSRGWIVQPLPADVIQRDEL